MESLIFHHGQKFKRNIHFLDQTSVWRKTDSLNEFSKKNNPSSTSYSNYSNTNISTTYSAPNRWDNIAEKSYHSRAKFANKRIYNNSLNEFSKNQSCPYYQNSFTWYNSSWKSVNKCLQISNKNKTDYRNHELNTTCYIQLTQQQQQNCLQMRIRPTITSNKENSLKKKQLMEKHF